MNWKKKAVELLNEHILEAYKRDVIHSTNTTMEEAIIKAMFDFGKLACKDQKRICAQKCSRYSGDFDLVINAPTVKFD